MFYNAKEAINWIFLLPTMILTVLQWWRNVLQSVSVHHDITGGLQVQQCTVFSLVILFFTHCLTKSISPFHRCFVHSCYMNHHTFLFAELLHFSLLLLKWLIKLPQRRKTPFCWCGQYGNAQHEQLFQVHEGIDSDISLKRLSFILVPGSYIILRCLWSLYIMLNHVQAHCLDLCINTVCLANSCWTPQTQCQSKQLHLLQLLSTMIS